MSPTLFVFRLAAVFFGFAVLCAPANAQLVISEFLASNKNATVPLDEDEDGDKEDWIEIANTSSNPVSLLGWYLTDNKGQPRSWALPNRTLPAGGFILIFASGKDRKPASGNLHTNFKLSNEGEYLALTKDVPGGGVEVVQAFDPFPIQADDISYGLAATSTTSLLASGASVKALVPSVANGGSVLGTTWTGAAANEPFNDAAWTTGTTGVGFPNAGLAATNLKQRLNFDASPNGTNVIDTSGANHPATNIGASWADLSTDAGSPARIRDGVMQFRALDSNGAQTGDLMTVPAHADFNSTSGTISFWMRSAGVVGPGTEAMIWDRRTGPATGQGATITMREDGLLSFQAADGTAVRCQFNSTTSVMDDRWHHVAYVFNQAAAGTVTCYIDGVASGSGTNQSPSWSWNPSQQIEIGRSHDTTWRRFEGELDDVRFYNVELSAANIALLAGNEADALGAPSLSLNLQSAMQNVNASAFLRIPFNVTNPTGFTSLNLKMRWSDGYVVYLNGSVVSSFAAPASPEWNSAATHTHSSDSVRTISPPTSLLRLGTNVLAIHLLNNSADNGTAFALPTLEGISQSFAATYLTNRTPGTANSVAKTNIGPFITDVTKDPVRPTGTAASPPLVITANVAPSLRPLAATNPVQLRYRIMYGSETTLNMLDNGVAPDAVAGDGIFSTQIPTNGLGAGQMLRWRVVATDNINATSTAPPYADTLDNEQYYGTVAVDSSIQTSLPVIYWFITTATAADNATGTRCSFFYKAIGETGVGRFYDNVEVNVHGQSSAGFAKKSYDLDFNDDNRFEWNIANERVKDVNLMTNWGDKSKTHNALTHEALSVVGSAYHWCHQIRVQQVTTANAGVPANHFFSIADLMEDGDDDWLERIGKDANGALYKIYDSLTGGGEKKTRKFENTGDLQALVSGLNPANAIATRRQYAYDNLDLPQCVSYFVGLAIASSQDHGHKNYYVYRDTLGTREWEILPWDTDLSWGRNWTDAGGYFTDTINSNNALNFYPGYNDGGSQGSVQNKGTMNRLYTLMFDVPEFRSMYLRRLRTVMDQYLQPPGTPNGILEARVNQMTDLMDPPAIATSDADRDRTKWSTWGNDGGNTLGGAVLRFHTGLLKTSYLTGRRNWLNSPSAVLFYVNPSTPGLDSEPIPSAQPANAIDGISLQTVDFNPTSGTQDHEYFVIRNSNSYAVDISGWQISGAVNFTFRGGTVIPGGGGTTQHIGDLFMARNPFRFRQRSSGPTGNQFCFVEGPYSGQLSARGETIELRDAAGTLLKTTAWNPAPTATQSQLRITELNFAPTNPTAAEKLALPGVVDGDFEYIELINIGTTSLNLSGAYFEKGITFTFPSGYTLAAGARCLLVSNQVAFQLRYGNGFNALIAGQYEGQLDDDGETIQVNDVVGESILEFRYDPTWFPPSDEGGRSIVVRNAAGPFQNYDFPTHWALSGALGGSPGTADDDFANVYEGWRWDHFTAQEIPTIAFPNLPAGLTADPDGDGRRNIEEYAFGGAGKVPDHNNVLNATIVNDGGTNYLAVTFKRRHKALDLTYIVEATSDLGNWTTVATQIGVVQDLGNGIEQVTVRDSLPFTPGEKRWMRVRALKP
jgi:hypothetical protein